MQLYAASIIYNTAHYGAWHMRFHHLAHGAGDAPRFCFCLTRVDSYKCGLVKHSSNLGAEPRTSTWLNVRHPLLPGSDMVVGAIAWACC
jgi:hypothetical protein